MTERKTSVGGIVIKAADKGEASVRFSTPDGVTPDKDREITGPNAFTEGAQAVVSPWGHRTITDGAIPAGLGTIHSDGTADLKLFLDTEAGRDTFFSMKGLGRNVQVSYGFTVTEEGELTPAMRAAGAVRYLKKLDVLEISPVVRGAGQSTGVLDLKSCGCTTEQPSRALRAALVADSRRILAEGAKILAAPTETPPLSPKQLDARISEAQWVVGFTPETQIDRERHNAASKAAAWVAAQWGVRAPAVKWFNPRSVPDSKTRGFFDPREPDAIWLRSNLFAWDLLEVLCHEGSHHGRHHGRHHARGLEQDETEVRIDANHLVRRYVAEVVDVQ